MFFNSKTHAAGYTDVFFCFELKGIVPRDSAATIKEAVYYASLFITSLYTQEAETAYELVAQTRTGTDPGPSLALRVRVSHNNCATALAKAQEAAKSLADGLALWASLEWSPMDEARYRQLFEGFYPGSIWEMSRRTALIDLAPGTYTAGAGRHGLSISPLSPMPNPFCRVMRILDRCSGKVRFSVAITPARISEAESKFIDAQRRITAQYMEDAETSPLSRCDPRDAACMSGLAALKHGSVYQLRVYAASSEPLPGIVVNNLASALAAPVMGEDPAGGFTLQLLEEPAAKQAAEGNLEHLRFNTTPFQAGAVFGRLPSLVSTVEAAMVFRFPTALCPGLARVQAAAPFTGPAEREGTLIGYASGSASERTEVRLSPEARLRHVYLCGQTGTGKSSLMLSMALQDVSAGHGLCLLDPHGQLYGHVLKNIPEARRKDVFSFDCSQPDPGFSFNMLEHSSPSERDRIVEHFLEIFGQLFDLKTTGGPVFEMYFRSALSLVMCDPQATLADFMRFFYDRDYRKHCIGLCQDAFVSDAWEKIVATAGGDMSLQNVAPYIVSKLSPFLFNQQTRGIVSCRKSTLDFNAIIRGRKIILVNLAKGTIGNLAASFIGMLFIEKVLRAAMHPANAARGDSNFYLFCDEFGNLASDGVGEILSEARKHRLGAVLANQFIGQLPPGVIRATLGNAANLLCMRLGVEDADLLAKYFGPVFDKAALLSLPLGKAAASILAGAAKPLPFLLSASNGLEQIASAPAPAKDAPSFDGVPAGVRAPKRQRAKKSLLKPDPHGEGR